MPADSWKLRPGLQNVGSFQVSGRPFASGSCLAPATGSASLVVRFPSVTKWFQIEPLAASQGHLRVAFSQNGLHGKGGSHFIVHASSSFRGPLDLKISELWFMSNSATAITFDIVAGLTNIPTARLDTDDRTLGGTMEAGGPNWSGSVGVG